MKLIRSGLSIAIISIAVATSATNARDISVTKIDAYLDQAHQAGLLNGNVLVADRGKVIVRRAIGWADASRSMPLKVSDRFDIGSISKEFDAVGLLILAEDGKLSLTDPVSKFLPDLPSWSATITISDLLHYTSGLPEIDWNTVRSDADAYKNLHALQQLDFPAGTHYAYNNNNTFLRRRVIEKISGMSFAKFLQTREFPKAGIRDAVIDPTEATPRVAKSFNAKYKQDPMTFDITGWTTVNIDDFFRWSNCITNFCLITPNSTRQIVTTQNAKWQTGLGHGEIVDDRLVRHVHDGNDHNFEALLMADPSKKRTILLLTNQSPSKVYAIADAINAILDGKPYVSLSAAKE